jgi:hypothetical protein
MLTAALAVLAVFLSAVSASCSDFSYDLIFNYDQPSVYSFSAPGGSDLSASAIFGYGGGSYQFEVKTSGKGGCTDISVLSGGECYNTGWSTANDIRLYCPDFNSNSNVVLSKTEVIAYFNVLNSLSFTLCFVLSSSQSQTFSSPGMGHSVKILIQFSSNLQRPLSAYVLTSHSPSPAGIRNLALCFTLVETPFRRPMFPRCKFLLKTIKPSLTST